MDHLGQCPTDILYISSDILLSDTYSANLILQKADTPVNTLSFWFSAAGPLGFTPWTPLPIAKHCGSPSNFWVIWSLNILQSIWIIQLTTFLENILGEFEKLDIKVTDDPLFLSLKWCSSESNVGFSSPDHFDFMVARVKKTLHSHILILTFPSSWWIQNLFLLSTTFHPSTFSCPCDFLWSSQTKIPPQFSSLSNPVYCVCKCSIQGFVSHSIGKFIRQIYSERLSDHGDDSLRIKALPKKCGVIQDMSF